MSKEKVIKMPTELIPINGRVLDDLSIYLALTRQMVAKSQNDIKRQAESSMLLDEDEAKNLLCRKEVENIKKSATAIAQYFGIIRMLTQHMTDDLNSIYDKREKFINDYESRMRENAK